MASLPRSFLNLTWRPGRWADTPLNYDQSLSVDLFERITLQVPACEEHEQENMRCLAQGYQTLYKHAHLLKGLIGPDLLDRAIEEANSAQSFHVAMGPSLLVWALNQPWAGEMYHDVTLSRWTEHCLGSRSTSETVLAANLFMAQLLALAPHIPVQYRASTALHALDALYRSHTPWKNPQHNALNAHYLELSYTLTQECATEKGLDGMEMHELWRQKAILALSESSRSGYPYLAQWLAESMLPLQEKVDVLAWSGPKSWAYPSVAAVLLPTLSQTEQERFNEMPWADARDDGAQVNQTLMQTYCPKVHSLIALVVQGDDWLDRTCVAHWVNRMGTVAEPVLDLPGEFMNSVPATGVDAVQ